MPRISLVRRGLLSFTVAGLVLVTGLVAQRALNLSGESALPRWQVAADVALTGLELERVDTSGLKMRLHADTATLVEADQQLNAKNLYLALFENGTEALSLRAEQGGLDLQSGVISVTGNTTPATLAMTDGTTVTTRTLSWDPDSRTIRSEDRATLTQQGLRATGDRVVANLDDRTVLLDGAVEVTWQP